MNESFAAAMETLERTPDRPEVFCDAFIGVFPVSGASVSTIGDVLGTETLAASDRRAARLDELQFDLGEGPCWDAMRSARPVLAPDVQGTGRTRWPSFSASLRDQRVSSVFAFPLVVGPLRFGAIDLYASDPVHFGATQTRQAGAMADVISRHVLRQALSSVAEGADDGGNAYSRRLIHQASGMVLAQIDVSADDARLVIQGHAFAAGRPMMEIAQDILDGRLRFARLGSRIEVVQ
ncbi:MAG TPA: GAF and ANTAR domain-containing protein [Microbacterium sp.]|uniref:GAF and ANTAR domain-containing protein n=1 Tax=Microbacterium sp. TaxID=51671 RepID=UPI002CC845D7|nr:GAF and ANTAR domain-containing protein [Microbacterium sp.]HWI32156.1 GAF and ANTAR domain-containing protein [Microbacterium sp.]